MTVGSGYQNNSVYPKGTWTWSNRNRKQDTSLAFLTGISWQIYFDLKGDKSGDWMA